MVERDAARDSGSGATRRRALGLGLAVATAGWTLQRTAAARPAGASDDAAPDEDALDEILARLHRDEPRARGGLSSHTAMAAEALCALGFSDRALAWFETDDSPWRELPGPSAPIERSAWRAALGPRKDAPSWEASNPRWADWKAFFDAELAEARWQDVLDTWLPRLAPGMSGAATHGVIRTSHAARALARRETSERRAELARGLGYWASSYEELPGPAEGPAAETAPRDAARRASYAEAVAELPLYFSEHGKSAAGRNIVEALRHVHELEGFAGSRDLVAAPDDVSAALSALSATFARAYLRHGTRHDTIAFVHAVTGPCALRRLAPHVRPETARAALPHAWQAAAAIYSTYARVDDPRREPEPRLARSELALRSAENGDVHAIKFTEVLLAEHALVPDPAYLAAAEDVIARL